MVTGNSGVGAKITEQAALTARLMLYGLLAIVLMAMDHRGEYVPRLRHLAGYLAEPVYHVVAWPVRAGRGVADLFRSSSAMSSDIQRLRQQLLAQRGDLQRLQTLTEENRRLRALLDGAASVQFSFEFAELVEVDLDPFSHRVIIDRGANRGVVRGQAVIDGAGVMGQVEAVHPHHATVRLISDPNHALPVQINRTGLRSVAFGMGNTALLNLASVPREADVREGDLVVTSGLAERFPAGYPVAMVAAVDRREGQMFAQVLIRPLAALDRGREVLLISTWDEPPDDSLGPDGLPAVDGGYVAPADAAETAVGAGTSVPADGTDTAGSAVAGDAGEDAENGAANPSTNDDNATDTDQRPEPPAQDERPA